MSDVNAVDLAFVVDTTGSMGPLIAAAKQRMVAMIAQLTEAADVDIRLATVEYRDHPPQDPLVYRIYPFTWDMAAAQGAIMSLSVSGGGDTPEAVLDGVLAAVNELKWRPRARRIAVLVGDAPPHGTGLRGDGFPRGCPCGQTLDSVTAAAEEARVTLYALGLTAFVADSFGTLARYTGGDFFPSSAGAAAIEKLRAILMEEFGHLELDRRVLAAWHGARDRSLDGLAGALGTSRPAVSSALSRLGARGLLSQIAP